MKKIIIFASLFFLNIYLQAGDCEKNAPCTLPKTYGITPGLTYLNGIGDKSYYEEMGVTTFGTIYSKESAKVRNSLFASLTGYVSLNMARHFLKNNYYNVVPLNSINTKPPKFDEIWDYIIIGATFGINQSSDRKAASYMAGITLGFLTKEETLFAITYGGFYDTVKTMPYPYRENFYHPLIPATKWGTVDPSFMEYQIPLVSKEGFFRGVGFTISKNINFSSDETPKKDEETVPPSNSVGTPPAKS
ncbi:MAG: hypothetical protein SFU98_00085 [Leptospiraceae bacterium]|nr:hypothetical protein [Leptospiraceae bacterium]